MGCYKTYSLGSDKYFMGSGKMILLLKCKGVWHLVIKGERHPAFVDEASYGECRDIALTTILLSSEDALLRRVIDIQELSEALTKLREMFVTVSQ